jgi:hypothetical protein
MGRGKKSGAEALSREELRRAFLEPMEEQERICTLYRTDAPV